MTDAFHLFAKAFASISFAISYIYNNSCSRLSTMHIESASLWPWEHTLAFANASNSYKVGYFRCFAMNIPSILVVWMSKSKLDICSAASFHEILVSSFSTYKYGLQVLGQMST